MSIFAIGDLHLSMDPRIKKPMDIFGDRWANHSQRLEKAWRETVGAEDTVIVAGDISWGLKLDEAEADLQWLNDLPGHKVMIKGNHDLWWTGITKLNRMYPNITFLQNECYEADGYFICGSRGWICPGADDFTLADDKIFKREVMRIERS
ncbi:MAG: metallophosphoesterase, partial [Anaerovoracaceae bacterium]